MAPAIISREDARAKGQKRYFTGKRCKNGHRAERFVINCCCTKCTLDRTDIWIEKNIEIKRACFRDWLKRNPKYQTQWTKKNPAKRRKIARAWYLKNAQESIERVLEWQRNNREKIRASVRNRKALRKKAQGNHTPEQILELLRRQKWKCVVCRASIRKRRHIDHIIALINGGSNDISNLQGLCPNCNCSKGKKDFKTWLGERVS